MYLHVHFSNGKSHYNYEINSQNPPNDAVIDAVSGLIKCVYGLELMAIENEIDPEQEPGQEEVRETLYDTVDEIVEQMFGHTDEAIS